MHTLSNTDTLFLSLAHWSLCATSLWWCEAGLFWAGLASFRLIHAYKHTHIHTPIRIHTTKTQRAWHLSDLSPRDRVDTGASVLSCPVLLDLQTGLGQAHEHTACINMMDNGWQDTGHFNEMSKIVGYIV